jgi:hypothetical protein
MSSISTTAIHSSLSFDDVATRSRSSRRHSAHSRTLTDTAGCSLADAGTHQRRSSLAPRTTHTHSSSSSAVLFANTGTSSVRTLLYATRYTPECSRRRCLHSGATVNYGSTSRRGAHIINSNSHHHHSTSNIISSRKEGQQANCRNPSFPRASARFNIVSYTHPHFNVRCMFVFYVRISILMSCSSIHLCQK